MTRIRALALAALLAGVLPAAAPAQERPTPRRLAVRAGLVLLGDGSTKAGVTILCEDGRITAIGADVQVPAGTPSLDAADGVVMAGLVEAGPGPGLAGGADEVTREITPTLDVLDAFDARAPALRRLLAQGVTAVALSPGDWNVIGGCGAVVKTVPAADGSPRVVKRRAFLKVALGPGPESGNYPPRRSNPGLYGRRPTTRMGTAWLLREAFERVRAPGPEDGPIVEACAGRLPVRASAHREPDLRTITELAGRFKFPLVVVGGAEAHRVVPVLKQVGASVVLAPLAFPPSDRGAADDGEIRLDTAARLVAAGVPLALTAISGNDSVTLREAAGLAIRGGLSRDAALAAITRGAADILGVGAEVGTLAVGRAADLVVCTGDPLEPTTRVRAVVVEGAIVWGPE